VDNTLQRKLNNNISITKTGIVFVLLVCCYTWNAL